MVSFTKLIPVTPNKKVHCLKNNGLFFAQFLAVKSPLSKLSDNGLFYFERQGGRTKRLNNEKHGLIICCKNRF